MVDVVADKVHNEKRQGEAFAPFIDDINQYNKKWHLPLYLLSEQKLFE